MKSLNLPYTPRIDQLRWFAATLVFLYHYALAWRGAGGAGLSSPWLGLITEGHTGVALFFTLSGFLFMRIAQYQGQIAYRPFVRNRLLRVAPLYLVVFLLALSIGRDKFQPQDVLYLLSANLGNAPTSQSVVTGAAWCIPLEFLFYLVFPFLAKFVLEQGAVYLWRLLALMLFFKVMMYGENERATLMYFSTIGGRFDQFLIGMLAAVLFERHQSWLARHAGWLLLPAAALAVAASALQAHVAPFNVVSRTPFWIGWSMLESAVWALVIVVWVGWQGRLPGWLERVMTHGGKISFSFYLLHMGVVHPLARTFGAPVLTGMPALDAALALALVYGAVWAVATLSYHAIEEPFLRLRSTYGTAPVSPSTN